MKKQNLLLFLVLIAVMLTVSCATQGKVEKKRRIAHDVFYSGHTVKGHVPSGYGKLTSRSPYNPSLLVTVVGSFEGNQIKDAAILQGGKMRFGGTVYYNVTQADSLELTLENGEIYDNAGNVRFEVTKDNPVVLKLLSRDLQGKGTVTTYVDPMGTARYHLLAIEGTAVGKTYPLEVGGGVWKVDASDALFNWNKYLFDTKEYNRCLNGILGFNRGDHGIFPERDPFKRMAQYEVDNPIYDLLKRMSDAYKLTRKGATYSFETYFYNATSVNDRDRVWKENDAYTFKLAESSWWGGYGLGSFSTTEYQFYQSGYAVHLHKPEYELTVKLSKSTLTVVTTGSIQLSSETVPNKKPKVNKFSVRDLPVFGGGVKGVGPDGYLSEGTTQTVTINLLGKDVPCRVSGHTELWATPIISSSYVYGVKKTGTDAFPLYRAKRTVTQTFDLNDLARKLGMSIQQLMMELARTGIDGVFTIHDGPVEDPSHGPYWGEISILAAAWMAGGFTTPDKEYVKFAKETVPTDYNKKEKNIWIATHLSRNKALDYCATRIESANSLSSLYETLNEIYPILFPDDDTFKKYPKSYFYSGLYFSSSSKITDRGPVANFQKRVHAKVTDLLSKEKREGMEGFLAAVELYGYNIDVPEHPIQAVFKALKDGCEVKAFYTNPTMEKGMKLAPKQDPVMREKIENVLAQYSEAAIASIKRSIERDILCKDADQLQEDLNFLWDVMNAMHNSGYQKLPNVDSEYLSSVEATLKYLLKEDKLAFAPKNSLGKKLIKSFLSNDVLDLYMPMTFVEGGSFTMGSTSLISELDEAPKHEVTVSSFYIGKYEVTQSQWDKVMNTGVTWYEDEKGDCPVCKVSWEEAKEFCARLSRLTGKQYRLPTEAEWEYAARGGKKHERNLYSGSRRLSDVGWCYEDGKAAHPCGTKKPNALGIYDMSGNVWEWCEDIYGPYSPENVKDPKGARGGWEEVNRVMRGGSWSQKIDWDCRVTIRGAGNPKAQYSDVGFRVVLVP